MYSHWTNATTSSFDIFTISRQNLELLISWSYKFTFSPFLPQKFIWKCWRLSKKCCCKEMSDLLWSYSESVHNQMLQTFRGSRQPPYFIPGIGSIKSEMNILHDDSITYDQKQKGQIQKHIQWSIIIKFQCFIMRPYEIT